MMVEQIGNGSIIVGVIVIVLFALLWSRKSKRKVKGISGTFPNTKPKKTRKERVQEKRNNKD